MNRIYRLVWCQALGAMVVASELASSRQRAGVLVRRPAGRPAAMLCAAILGALGLFHSAAASAQDAKLADLQALVAKYDTSHAAVQASARVAAGPVSAAVGARVSVAVPHLAHAPALAGAQAAKPAPRRIATLASPLKLKADVHAHAASTAAATGASLHARAAVASAPVPVHAGADAKAHLTAHDGAHAPLPAVLPQAARIDAKAGAVVAAGLPHRLQPADPASATASDRRLVYATAPKAIEPTSYSDIVGGEEKEDTAKTAAKKDDDAATTSPSLAPAVAFAAASPLSTAAGLSASFNVAAPQAFVANAVPTVPAPSPTPTGLIIGNGGVVGTATQLLGPTANSLFNNTDGYVSSGSLRVSSANFTQGYSTLSALGIPLLNLTPVGSLLTTTDGTVLGGTGTNSHLTLVGGVTSGNYITNINNGAAGGLLGLVLPDKAPAWASTCLNVLGILKEQCWALNAAQDYQVLVGDGASANGSKEVVIGTNASHTLASVDASTAFPGNGLNDPNNPSGVPTADYATRLGHSVVIGDDAAGTANAQTIVGAEATSSVANSVALGYKSAANRGAVANYTAYGLTAPQNSAGEVSVGAAGQERQITNVAAGRDATDAVNVAQLQGVANVAGNAVQYDDASHASVTLAGTASTDGGVTGGTRLGNLRQGALNATSTDAVNGAQLFATNKVITNIYDTGIKYFHANSSGTDSSATGTDSIAIGPGSQAISESSIAIGNGAVAGDSSDLTRVREVAIGNGAKASAQNTVALGDGAIATGPQSTAVGSNAQATIAQATALGRNATAGNNGTALGMNAKASGVRSTAVGQGAQATVTDGTSLGQFAAVTATGGVALGVGATADRAGMAGATELFSNMAVTSTAGAVSVGAAGAERQITNVAGGTADTDAVNVRQLSAVNNQVQDLSNLAVRYDTDGSGNATNHVTLVGDDTGVPIGISNLAAGNVADGSTDAINGSQLAATNTAVANYFGGTTHFDSTTGAWTGPTFTLTSIAADGSSTSGDYTNVTDAFSAVDGSVVNINKRIDTINNGGGIKYFHANSSAADSSATGADSVAIGGAATASSGGGVALGSNAVADRAGMAGATERFSNAAVASTAGAVSVGAAGAERQITNVAGGTADTDAVNVRQLSAVNDRVQNVGKLAVKYDADASGNPTNKVTLAGDGSGAPVAITNLADGNVAAGSTDAVNGGQLAATNTAVANYFGGTTHFDPTTGAWTGPTFTLTSIAADGSSTSGDYSNVTDAFSAVDGSLVNVNKRIDTINNGGIKYFHANSSGADGSATGADSIAVGSAAAASGDGSLAVGKGATASAGHTMAIGDTASATADNALAIGMGAQAGMANSIALGAGSSTLVGALTGYTAYGLADPQDSTGELNVGGRQITGVAAGAAATDAVNVAQLKAVDNHIQAVDKLAVKYDADTSGNATNRITLAGDGGGAPVAIGNLAAGAETAASTGAVNGSQLWHWTQDTTNVYSNTSLYDAITNLQQGSGKVKYFNVNSTLADSSATGSNSVAIGPEAKAGGTDSVAMGNGANASADDSVAIGAGSVADRAGTVSVGSAGNERQITNVAAGTADTDAANVGQVKSAMTASTKGNVRYDTRTDGSVDYANVTLGNGSGNTTIHNVAAGVADTDAVNMQQFKDGMQQTANWAKSYTDQEVERMGNRANAGVAAAMAMAGLPQAYEPGKSMASVAGSTFRGESSLAIGVSMISEGGRWVYKLSGSTNSRGDAGVTVGAGMQW
ncbi:hypothetical protein ASG87_11505 [Frateuria sp. Soil773]|uniref:YadA-like family protein n=1 Tax=Frateuria sp. Soil773 TaxID=1736407 RepID=UPI0006F72DC9|nr:YadA-like family protein [Frateuria sp. Soil773]KRF02101.1 hypothetical protein ASG87_11505 [Frateuria sp. Soil773]